MVPFFLSFSNLPLDEQDWQKNIDIKKKEMNKYFLFCTTETHKHSYARWCHIERKQYWSTLTTFKPLPGDQHSQCKWHALYNYMYS